MANELDEMTGPVNKEGRDVNVIEKQIKVEMTTGLKVLNVMCVFPGVILLGIPTIVWLYKKAKAKEHFQKLQQKIQHDASQIDNFLEQRVMILQNVARLLDKAIDLTRRSSTTRSSTGSPPAPRTRPPRRPTSSTRPASRATSTLRRCTAATPTSRPSSLPPRTTATSSR